MKWTSDCLVPVTIVGGAWLAPPLPMFFEGISAGFPSPAEGYEDDGLNVHDLLVTNPAATFFIRFVGDAMIHEHVLDGSILVVDRSVTPRAGRLVIVREHGEDLLVRFAPGHRVYCRGVVVGVIHRF